MPFGTRARFEAVKEIAFSSIVGGYVAVGTETTDHTRLLSIHNTTDMDLYVSLDGVTDNIRVASLSGQVFDLTTNRNSDGGLFIDKGTIFYVKTAEGAPTDGYLWIEILYADGGT